MRHRILLICVVTLLYSWPICSGAASFNCAKAKTPNEVLICGDPRLSALYRAAKAVTKDSVAFKKETTEEWRRRENCTDRDCLVGWYNRRIAKLAAARNHAQIAQAPSQPLVVQSPPAKAVAVAVAPADNPIGFSTFILVIAGLYRSAAGIDTDMQGGATV